MPPHPACKLQVFSVLRSIFGPSQKVWSARLLGKFSLHVCYTLGRQLEDKVLLNIFWEFHRAAAMLPKQGRGTFRKHNKTFSTSCRPRLHPKHGFTITIMIWFINPLAKLSWYHNQCSQAGSQSIWHFSFLLSYKNDNTPTSWGAVFEPVRWPVSGQSME